MIGLPPISFLDLGVREGSSGRPGEGHPGRGNWKENEE